MKLSENALTILKKRYLWPGETPEGMLKRVAEVVSGNNSIMSKKYFDMMDRLEFLPNSPTLMNAGKPGGQLAACFVLPVEDSMTSIMAAATAQAMIFKSGGGTGFNFSALRSEGSPIQNSIGTASGPVSFMELFDKVTDVVKAGGGRRGANMGILDCDHPDLEKFIRAKTEQGKLTNFNISVMATDEWMAHAVASGDPLFDLIVERAWANGDPGLLFKDRINEGNTTPWLGDIEATNPCVTGDTLILTDTGYQRIDDLVNKRVNVWNGEEWSEVVPAITGENQPVMEISFSDGSTLKCTPYHKFLVQEGFARNGKFFEAKAEELHAGMRIAKFKFPIIPGVSGGMSESEAYINGFYSGDGATPDARGRHVIQVYGEKEKLIPYLIHHTRQYNCNIEGKSILVADPEVMREKFWVPGTECSVSERLAWLAGLIDADGAKNSIDGSVNITSIKHDFLMQVKRMINTLGENATVAQTHDERTKKMPDGHGGLKEYDCQTCYRLLINASTIERLKHIGLNLHRVDVHPATDRDASRFIRVTGVRLIELQERYVYCFNEPKRHMGVFNGVLTFQCGETPLYPYEACNLGSINIAAFVNEDGEVDFKRLEDVTRLAVRFLDDVIDVNCYPLPEIEEAAKRTRKIGLGIMGWADALIKMGIPYGSKESIDKATDIWRFVDSYAFEESKSLAEERGAYPAFQGEVPIRNATRTCIAPTGTISLIADVSSGIEPVFAFEHTRKAFAGEQELKYVHPLMEQAKREGWYDPDVFVEAHQIPYDQQIRMQAAFQKHTDLAVSKTINFPSTATREEVKNALLLAWDSGCKGITVYRDGCREGQVLTNKAKEKPTLLVNRHEFPYRRPEGVISGKTAKMPTSFGNLYVTLNYLDDGVPIEAFSTIGKSGADMESCTEAIGRLMSLALRYNVPLSELVDQMKGISGAQPVWDQDGKSVLSIPDGIARCLEELTGEVRTVKSGELCPECGGMTERGEGCLKCPECGWSRC